MKNQVASPTRRPVVKPKAVDSVELTKKIVARFGGGKRLAEIMREDLQVQIGTSGVNNWQQQTGIPGKYHLLLLGLAKSHGVELTGEELLATTRHGPP